MALTAAQTTQVFKVFGIPQSGIGYSALDPSAPYASVVTSYNYSAAKDRLNTILAALSASQEAEVGALLTEWAAITDYSELRVNADGGSAGRLMDHDTRREKVRSALANVLGFAAPGGGFAARVAAPGLAGGDLVR